MRKYQQLLLVTISCLSLIVLLVYKSENSRLKDVLNVVNIFGRNATNGKMEINSIGVADANERFMFTVPMPAWQVIGSSFYAYSAYWNPKDFRNEIGGDVIAIVAAESVRVDFQCYLLYERQRRVAGKFRFQRVGNVDGGDKTKAINYHFFCQTTERGEPQHVVFIDESSKSKTPYKMKLRSLVEERNAAGSSALLYVDPLLPAICVDLVTEELPNVDAQIFESRMLQFFMHHHIMGVRHFIIYNSDALPRQLLPMLQQFNAQLHLLPFNYPFSANTSSLRSTILTDCIMRTHQLRGRFTTLLRPNEFLYINGQLSNRHVTETLLQPSTKTAQLQLHVYPVCIGETHKLLMDNVHFDSEKKPSQIVLYRKQLSVYTANDDAGETVSQSSALAVRYMACKNMGNDGLHDWQNTLREDFMQYVAELRKRMEILL